MDFAITWLPIIGPVVIAYALTIWALPSGNNSHAVWVGFWGALMILLAMALHLQNIVLKAETASTQLQRPAVDQTVPASYSEQAPWISIQQVFAIPPVPQIGDTFEIKVNFRNTGNTAALKVTGVMVADPVFPGQRPNFDYTEEKKFSLGEMAPGVDYHAPGSPVNSISKRTPANLTPEIHQQLISGAVRVFAHGRIDYEDALGNPHWLTFCYRLAVPITGIFHACEDHNESDRTQRVKK